MTTFYTLVTTVAALMSTLAIIAGSAVKIVGYFRKITELISSHSKDIGDLKESMAKLQATLR